MPNVLHMVMTEEARALRAATHEVEEARRVLARATSMTSGWSSPAADKYRAATEVAAGRVHRVAVLLEAAVVPVAALGASSTPVSQGVLWSIP